MTHPTSDWLPGLCSVTFRQLSCEQIIALAQAAGLKAIEWGTDVHLPGGDTIKAERVAALCQQHDLLTPTLGSYLRSENDDQRELANMLQIAGILGAERIRVWAGKTGSELSDRAERARLAACLQRYCDAAAEHGVMIALEYHPNTLTDTAESAAELLTAVNHPALAVYWQPTPELSIDQAIKDIDCILPWLCDLHVFHWIGDRVRRPLSEGQDFWQQVFRHVDYATEPTTVRRLAFLEFVEQDEPENLVRDASVLHSLCGV